MVVMGPACDAARWLLAGMGSANKPRTWVRPRGCLGNTRRSPSIGSTDHLRQRSPAPRPRRAGQAAAAAPAAGVASGLLPRRASPVASAGPHDPGHRVGQSHRPSTGAAGRCFAGGSQGRERARLALQQGQPPGRGALARRLGSADHRRGPQHQHLPQPLVAAPAGASRRRHSTCRRTRTLWLLRPGADARRSSAASAQGRARPRSAARTGTGQGRSRAPGSAPRSGRGRAPRPAAGGPDRPCAAAASGAATPPPDDTPRLTNQEQP